MRRGRLGWTGVLALVGVLALGRAASAAEPGALFAGPIDADNAGRVLVGGPDAIGGVGDWALGNGTLCAVISGSAHEAMLSVTGGVLIDLGHCGRRDDQWGVFHPLVNLSRANVVPILEGAVRAETDSGEARIVTTGSLHGLSVVTTYALDRFEPDRLRVTSVIERVAPGPGLMLFGDVVLHGNRQLAPFSLDSNHPEASRGFQHPPTDPDDLLGMFAALGGADTVVLVGGDAVVPGISYGFRRIRAQLVRADGRVEPLPGLSIHGTDFSLLAALSRPPWIGNSSDLGLLELAQLPFMDLGEDEKMLYEREIWLGKRADVASATDRLFRDAPRLSGKIDDPSARIHVWGSDGTPVSELRSEPDGRFALQLPAGSYRLEAQAPGGRRIHRELLLPAEGFELETLEVGPPARVVLPRGRTMRLIFVGEDGARPRLRGDLLGFRVGEDSPDPGLRSNHVSLAAAASDPREVVLAAGRYRVFATRGPEFSVERVDLELSPGETHRLQIKAPERVLETPGWVSADLHLHSEASHDSALPVGERVRSIVAQGVDVAVATEHDRVFDYGPEVRALGLGDRLVTLVGVEATSTVESPAAPHTIGHSNAFPLTPRPLAYRGGAPRAEGVRMRDLAASLRALEPRVLLQLNHPRSKDGRRKDLSYLTHLGSAGVAFEPTRSLSSAPNRVLLERDQKSGLRDLDFDLIELLNGSAMGQYRQTRADWWSLALQGEFRAATASSDSHRSGEIVALPRTYVRMPDSDPKFFDPAVFVEALARGASYGTTGPILEVRLGEAEPGGFFRGKVGQLAVDVRSAPWVDASRVKVTVNASRVFDGPLAEDGSLRLPLRFERDSLVVVEVEGEPSEEYRAVAPGFVPFAFSNPIFVDVEPLGDWEPPGLGSPPSRLLTHPLGPQS